MKTRIKERQEKAEFNRIPLTPEILSLKDQLSKFAIHNAKNSVKYTGVKGIAGKHQMLIQG